MCKELICKLAQATQSSMSPHSYGHLRKKLDKQGFSEIALYSAMAMHCEENELKPQDITGEMIKLLQGCSVNALFPKSNANFSYLKGQFFDLRHGDLEKGESKSPEQRGQFLCNKCFLVKDKDDVSKSKNQKFTCHFCSGSKKSTKTTLSLNKKNAVEVVPPAATQCTKGNAEERERRIENQEVKKENDTSNNRQHPLTSRHDSGQHPLSDTGSTIVITEIIADDKEANISLKCDTKELVVILEALNLAQQQ